MRRRDVSAAVVLTAVGAAALLRGRRRAARAVAHGDHAAIAATTGERALLPQPQVEPEPAMVMEPVPRFLSIPWSTSPDPPPPSATELRLHCTLTSPAMELARVDVRETASQVFVTVLARWRPRAEEAPSGGTDLKRTATAKLRAPLGDRALVHAPHDDAPR
jgi:hypothetical protein